MNTKSWRLKGILAGIAALASCILSNFQEAAANEKIDNATGWWILSEYHDQILQENAIGKFSLEPPVYEAILVQITTDSVFTTGTECPNRKEARLQGDTILKIGTNGSTKIVFNKRKRQLTVVFTNRNKQQVTYHYRRLLSHEFIAITKDVFNPNKFWPLKQNYRAWFVAHLIAGSYRNVKDGHELTMNRNESMNGFEKWNAFEIDDYFGTGHRTVEWDMIRLQDSTRTGSFKDYYWRWQKDTLVLIPATSQDAMIKHLSLTEFKFVRSITQVK